MSGTVVWICGLPASGKSTLAEGLAARLREAAVPCAVLDGDAVREALDPRPGYASAEREAFYRTLAALGALLARQGLVAIVAATAHKRVFRERARELAPRFLEVLVDTPPAECAARDPKGLYARAREGRVASLPGIGEPFERPTEPAVIARGGRDAEALDTLVAAVRGTSWPGA